MKGRSLYRLLLGVWVLVLCTATLQAQDEYDSDEVLVDSAAVAPPQAEEPITYRENQQVIEPPAYRQVPDSVVSRLKKQKDFAYANDPAYWANKPEETDEDSGKDFWDRFNGFFGNDGVRVVMYALLIAFFLFIIYRVAVVNNLFLFYRSKKVNNETAEAEGDIEDENLDEKIIKAIDQHELRMAVRFMYLKSLRLLNDRQWIHYNAQATNYEYVNQMSGHKMAGEFRFLTRVYDYVWYGEFALTNEQFAIVQKNFQHFYNAVK